MSEETQWELAQINGTNLGYEGHGILTSHVHLSYASPEYKLGGSGQGFGGYGLGGEDYMRRWVQGVIDAVGVSQWEDLKGEWVWAEHSWTKVHAIKGVKTGKEFRPWD